MSINLFSAYDALLSRYKCGLGEEVNILPKPILIRIENDIRNYNVQDLNGVATQVNDLHSNNTSTSSVGIFIFFIVYLETGNYNFDYPPNSNMFISFSGDRITDKPDNGNYDIRSGMYYVCINFNKIINQPITPETFTYLYQFNKAGNYLSLDKKILKCQDMSLEDTLNYNYRILDEECYKNPTTYLCKNYYKNTPNLRKDLETNNIPKSIANYFNGVMNFLDYYDTDRNNNYPTYTEWVSYNNCPTKCGKGFRGKTRYETKLLPMQSGTSTIIQREDINCDINCDKETLWSHAWSKAAQCTRTTVPTSFKNAFPDIDTIGVDGVGGDTDIQTYRTKLNLTPWASGTNATNSVECYGSSWPAGTSFKINTMYYSQDGSTYMRYTPKLFEIVRDGTRVYQLSTTGNYTSFTFSNATWSTNTRGYAVGAQYQILRLVSDNNTGGLIIDSEYLRLSSLILRNGRLEIVEDGRILKYIGSRLSWYNGLSLWVPFMVSTSHAFDFSNECRIFNFSGTQYLRFHRNGDITVYRTNDNAMLGSILGTAYSRTYTHSTPRGSSTLVAVENVSFANNNIVFRIRSSSTSVSDRNMTSSFITTFLSSSSFENNTSEVIETKEHKNIEQPVINYIMFILLLISAIVFVLVLIICSKKKNKKQLNPTIASDT